VVVEFTQPRPTKASVGTRTNMLRARECLRSRVASLCQPVHQCVSPHTDLSMSLQVVDESSGSTAFPINVFNSNALGDLLLLVLICSRMSVLCCLAAACWRHSHQAAASSSSAHNVSLTTAGACMTTSTTGDCCVSRCSDGHLARREQRHSYSDI